MDLGNLVNDNISKKMGIGILAMYMVSKTQDRATGFVIAAIAVVGIISQAVIDVMKTRKEQGNG